MSFTEKDVQIVKQAIKLLENKERGLAIKKMKEIPYFKSDINWLISWMIQDMDKQDKGINENRAMEYLYQALDWVKTHQDGE